MTPPTIAEQEDAFSNYLRLKDIADRTRDLNDARAAGHAWLVYLDLFLPDEKKLSGALDRGANVETFPVNRTRPTTKIFGDR
ncbi:hypothetical protein [Shinella sp.]|uniref:hypothetical protein n=1 Tax=Shinella sp. TaxID=1870904 RepID=UPI003F710C8C